MADEFAPGDRIEMVRMAPESDGRPDPCPITAGTQGTIERVSKVDLGDGPFLQLRVKWDNGRTLSPIIPPDEVRHI